MSANVSDTSGARSASGQPGIRRPTRSGAKPGGSREASRASQPSPFVRQTEVQGLVFPALDLGHLAASLKKQLKRFRKALRRCQRKFSEKAIHSSRVESRRLLATIELLAGFLPDSRLKKNRRAIKAYLDNFDELRDTQVQLELVGKLGRHFPAAESFHAFLVKREERLTRQTRKRIGRFKAGRLCKSIDACREELEVQRARRNRRQAVARVLRSVNSAYARTRRLRARINPDDSSTIHRTRVAFKKFRYMVETLCKYLPGATRRRLEAMHDYQTIMGEIQDSEVLRVAFDKFLHKRAVDPDRARRLRAELLQRQRRLIRTYLKSADQLIEFWPLTPSDTGRRARNKADSVKR